MPREEPSSCAAGYIDVRAVHSGYDCTGDDPCICRYGPGSIDKFPGRSDFVGARIEYRHKEPPHFSMKAPDGTWQGIGIELWRRVAGRMTFTTDSRRKPNVQNLLDGIVAGKYDMGRSLRRKWRLMLPSKSCCGRLPK
jgi:hypothetical protein